MHPGLGFERRKDKTMSGVMNKDWNDSEWFVEWLKLARSDEGNKKVIA